MLIASAILLLAVVLSLWHLRSVPVTVSLNLSGSSGLKVAGRVVVDGVPRDFTGVLPTNVTVRARSFEYTILMQEPRGVLRGDLSVGGRGAGSSQTAEDFAGVRGRYVASWGAQSVMVTVERKGE